MSAVLVEGDVFTELVTTGPFYWTITIDLDVPCHREASPL